MNVRIDSSRQHQHAFGIDRFCAGRRRQVPSNFGDDTVANAKVCVGASHSRDYQTVTNDQFGRSLSSHS